MTLPRSNAFEPVTLGHLRFHGCRPTRVVYIQRGQIGADFWPDWSLHTEHYRTL
jgi:hypothetical protein